jgi:hypothetical protein
MYLLQIAALIIVAFVFRTPMTMSGVTGLGTSWAIVSAVFFIITIVLGIRVLTTTKENLTYQLTIYGLFMRVLQLFSAVSMAIAINSENPVWGLFLFLNLFIMALTLFLG